jgi:glycosyltransferase involved in cell wall biosynthesis
MSGTYCVLIPAYNAGHTLGPLVQSVKTQGLPVVVIDDGSRDNTAAVAAQQGALVISHLQNQGKGLALRTGFDHALRGAYDGIITMDGDGQHDPAEIPHLIKEGERQHAGIVVGDRMANGHRMPPSRQWTNRVMSRIISTISRQQIPDSQCGFRLIRREVLQQVPLRSRCFEIESELLLAAAARKWKIVSVPVRAIYEGHPSHIRPVRDGLRFVWLIALALLGRLK